MIGICTQRLFTNLHGKFGAVTAVVPVSDRSQRGEQTASALETRLTAVESRIDQLLASVQGSTGREEPLPHPEEITKENGHEGGKH
jgi:hypothetical protein